MEVSRKVTNLAEISHTGMETLVEGQCKGKVQFVFSLHPAGSGFLNTPANRFGLLENLPVGMLSIHLGCN